jgi:hypothetical protein
MPTVAEVRDSLAEAITTATGLRCSALVPDQMVAPIAVISRREFDPRYVFTGDRATYLFRVTIYADRTNERVAQIALDEYTELSGELSVLAAIQDGDNWTATIDYAQVTLIGEVQSTAIAESQYLVVSLDVEVVW